MKKSFLFFTFICFTAMIAAQEVLSLEKIKQLLIMGDDQIEWRVYKEKSEQQNPDDSYIAAETYYHDNFMGALMFDDTTYNYLWVDDENTSQDEANWDITKEYNLKIFNSTFGAKPFEWELVSVDNDFLVLRTFEVSGNYKIALLKYYTKGNRLSEAEAAKKNEVGIFPISEFTKTMYQRSLNKN